MTGVSRDEQRRFWDRQFVRRSPSHRAVVAFARSKVRWILDAIAGRPGSLLEVGCGNGYFSVALESSGKTTCIDFSVTMLATNPAAPGRKVQALAEALPFGDTSFDLVVCGNLLHHLEDPSRAVAEMARVSRKYVALIEPNARNPLMFLFALLKREEHGALKFSARYVQNLGSSSGLRLRASTTQGSILPNKTPGFVVPWLAPLERSHPLGFYTISLFEKLESGRNS
jgi:SAM-dependent methyltransferase